MSPKWAKQAHFGGISYNVFNTRKYSFLMLEVSKFMIECRLSHVLCNDYQQLTVLSQIINIEEKLFARFWCYRVYKQTI